METTYKLTKYSKTKSETVGYFDTKESAIEAMQSHFVNNSKRGKFYYCIAFCELSWVGGVKMISCDYRDVSKYQKNEVKL